MSAPRFGSLFTLVRMSKHPVQLHQSDSRWVCGVKLAGIPVMSGFAMQGSRLPPVKRAGQGHIDAHPIPHNLQCVAGEPRQNATIHVDTAFHPASADPPLQTTPQSTPPSTPQSTPVSVPSADPAACAPPALSSAPPAENPPLPPRGTARPLRRSAGAPRAVGCS
eukprot:366221-Chlamydomonas_euryale.AAC.3